MADVFGALFTFVLNVFVLELVLAAVEVELAVLVMTPTPPHADSSEMLPIAKTLKLKCLCKEHNIVISSKSELIRYNESINLKEGANLMPVLD
jgi:hypothetical protein